MGQKSAVFLDRDGVINQMVYHPEFGLVDSPANPDQFCLLPGVARAISVLNNMDFLVVVVTNQPGIAKGKFTQDMLEATTLKMLSEIKKGGGHIDDVYCCLHHPDAVLPELKEKCDCRKPKPGLLFQAAQKHNIDLSKSYMVGDGITDIQAGKCAGTSTLFVSSRKCYICDSLVDHDVRPDYMVKDLLGGVNVVRSLAQGHLNNVEPFRFKCDL